MVSIKTVAAIPDGARRGSVEYVAIAQAATDNAGQWQEVEIEGRTLSQLGGIATQLKKKNVLFEVKTRTVGGKPLLYVKARETVAKPSAKK